MSVCAKTPHHSILRGMNPSYPVPAGQIRRELMVANSRFVATLAPVSSVEEAREFIAAIKRELSDASSHIPAYRIGGGEAVIEHCSDGGEPSGTAGRPSLAVLRGSGLGDAALVISRYFGGTKLGTGGLVRAFSDAARLVVEAVPRAYLVPTCTVMVQIHYSRLEQARRLAAAHHGKMLGEDYGAEVVLSIRFPTVDFPSFQAALRELTGGGEALVISSETVKMALPPAD